MAASALMAKNRQGQGRSTASDLAERRNEETWWAAELKAD